MSKYKGMDHAAAVAERKAEMEKWRKMWEESPKCKHCGGNPITLLDGQPKGVCMCCFKKGLK
jgi:hypothetical protein